MLTRTTQATRGFKWGFKLSSPRSFQQCQEVPIIALPLANGSFYGSPPYYMIALEAGGIPTTSAIGDDPENLLWTVDHKQGTVLMLTVADSKNQIGGFANTQYTIESPASGSSCLPTAPKDLAVITPNVTDSLATCQPWGLSIAGGKKPYTVVLTALNSTTVSNATLGLHDDTFTYINRADPNIQLMASVVDANGQWGKSTSFVNTTGSTDASCPGVESSSTGPPGSEDTSDTPSHASKAPLIAGLVVGLLLISIIGVLGWLWWRRRRNQRHAYNGLELFDESEGTWDEHHTGEIERTGWFPTSLVAGGVARRSSSRRVRIVQHHDAEIVHELPPPYAEGAAARNVPREPPPEKITLRPRVVGEYGADTTSAGAGSSKNRAMR